MIGTTSEEVDDSNDVAQACPSSLTSILSLDNREAAQLYLKEIYLSVRSCLVVCHTSTQVLYL